MRKKPFRKQLYKKCKYEHTMYVILALDITLGELTYR